MKMRKLLPALALCLLLAMLPVSASAQAVTSGTCGTNVTWSFDSSTGRLTISGTGPMQDYDETAPSYNHAPWISAQLSVHITEVVIEEGVTTIGEYAFYWLDHLVSVTVPESVTEIGTGAFIRCEALTDITLPEGLTELGYRVFEDCFSLPRINIPDGVAAIRQKAFSGCYSLEEVIISENCKIDHIGPDAFYGCSLQKGFVFPDSVRMIGVRAFQYAWLTSITIPASVTKIDNSAFLDCLELREIIFEGDAPQIGQNAFSYVHATAYYPADNATWTEEVMQQYGGTITWHVAGGHVYEAAVTAPTCTSDGYTTYTCICGDSYEDDTVPALGHTMGQWVTESEPTEGEYGVKSRTCDACGAVQTVKFDKNGIRGDLSGNGEVGGEDVSILLWHTLFAEVYPLEQNADFNGDGVVNDADVSLLLWHALFPDAYPL